MNHDRKRVQSVSEAERAAAAAEELARCKEYEACREKAVALRAANALCADALAASGALLQLNAEYSSMWNYRRRILTSILDASENPAAAAELLKAELKFSADMIRTWPKSYWVFLHRQHIITWMAERLHTTEHYAQELELVSLLIKLDSRNFHGWNYRRWLSEKAGTPDSDEFKYTTAKVDENFSNYSAWHQRSLLLPRLHPEPADYLAAVQSELSLLHNAFFTEPDDSSAWVYLRWLLVSVSRTQPVPAPLLAGELEVVEELLSLEPDSKWPLVAKVWLLEFQNSADNVPAISALLTRLASVDAGKRAFYEAWRARAAGGL